jgi:hypothetical protein
MIDGLNCLRSRQMKSTQHCTLAFTGRRTCSQAHDRNASTRESLAISGLLDHAQNPIRQETDIQSELSG